jgi:hypothetical protein
MACPNSGEVGNIEVVDIEVGRAGGAVRDPPGSTARQ